MKQRTDRRSFLRAGAAGTIAPFLWTGRVKGAVPANDRITAAAIGTGRMGRGNLGSLLGYDEVEVVAVCDVDADRCRDARLQVEKRYASRKASGEYRGCREYRDFRDVLARPDIDAVLIVTPDHWHGLNAIEAARAGKDIYLQKPLTYTVHEGRVLSDTVRRYGRVLQVGSQQRSDPRFRFACELVRNGRIGKIRRVEVGCPLDPHTAPVAPTPAPPELDYDLWLGPAPYKPYNELRVHPAEGYSRPGWLRVRDYTVGNMTGWGSHHIDITQWALGMEHSGPRTISAWAAYEDGPWDVHQEYNVKLVYPNGVPVFFGDHRRYRQGVTFYGETGRVFVSRGALEAEPASLLQETLGAGEIHLYRSANHMGNFVDCIRSRRAPVAPVEVGHRSNTTCVISDIAARLGRPLQWDAEAEQFVNDETANRMLWRPMRNPWHV
ncbi:Gfo/Idh/MocA family protein [Kiritimatiella glycovorans]|uniref:Inositol 2-dehydrogenase n=1 Tax=Kiritimatiella glycovorans TaxID=1307763 RepID=A0A0G3EFE0_9BACT|nr:Gfo/Idh/MocA family oxidoreductase [Kiritimatiella glycovorans]AKJ63500.1 Inositol 2-dehydrogenase [Kiritimatiella glycovorans]